MASRSSQSSSHKKPARSRKVNSELRKQQNRIASRNYREKRKQKLLYLQQLVKDEPSSAHAAESQRRRSSQATEFVLQEADSATASSSLIPYDPFCHHPLASPPATEALPAPPRAVGVASGPASQGVIMLDTSRPAAAACECCLPIMAANAVSHAGADPAWPAVALYDGPAKYDGAAEYDSEAPPPVPALLASEEDSPIAWRTSPAAPSPLPLPSPLPAATSFEISFSPTMAHVNLSPRPPTFYNAPTPPSPALTAPLFQPLPYECPPSSAEAAVHASPTAFYDILAVTPPQHDQRGAGIPMPMAACFRAGLGLPGAKTADLAKCELQMQSLSHSVEDSAHLGDAASTLLLQRE